MELYRIYSLVSSFLCSALSLWMSSMLCVAVVHSFPLLPTSSYPSGSPTVSGHFYQIWLGSLWKTLQKVFLCLPLVDISIQFSWLRWGDELLGHMFHRYLDFRTNHGTPPEWYNVHFYNVQESPSPHVFVRAWCCWSFSFQLWTTRISWRYPSRSLQTLSLFLNFTPLSVFACCLFLPEFFSPIFQTQHH